MGKRRKSTVQLRLLEGLFALMERRRSATHRQHNMQPHQHALMRRAGWCEKAR
jgi:hypothetical protein